MHDSPLRVALVTETYPPEINGVALTLSRLVSGLKARGHIVDLIRPRQKQSDIPGPHELLTTGLPIPGYPDLRFGLPAHGAIRRRWSQCRPDIVHVATEGPLGAAAVGAARALDIPISSSFHTNFRAYSHHYRLGWLRHLVGGHLRRLHNRTDLTMVPTPALAEELRQQGYHRLDILARGIDTRLFNPGRRSDNLRTLWGVAPDDLVIAYVGRLAPEKNLDLVSTTYSAIASKQSRTRLLFVGDGPSMARLRQSHPDAIFAGMRRDIDLAAHYASADIFLFPSLTETYGNVVPEAMASSLGVVAFNCAAAADLIISGDNGLKAPPGDDLGFIDRAVSLVVNRKKLAEIRVRAAESIRNMDWEHINERFLQLINTVLSARHNGRRRS